jgi:hypothetical protein
MRQQHDQPEPQRALSAARISLGLLCLASLTVIGAGAAIGTLRRTHDLARERSSYASLSHKERANYVAKAFDVPGVFERFRMIVPPRERYTLVLPQAEDADRAALYRAFSLYYLHPRTAVAAADQADAVLVFGAVPASILRSFRRVALVDGGWIGLRR